MSNLMHKVKDAISGHNEHKRSSHESSAPNMENNQPGANSNLNSSAMGSDLGGAHGTNAQDTSIHNLNPQMNTGNDFSNNMNTTGSVDRTPHNAEQYGSAGYNAGGLHNTEKSNMQDSFNFPSNTMDPTENYGPGRNESGSHYGGSRLSDTMPDTVNTNRSNAMNTTGMDTTSYGVGGSDMGAHHEPKRDTGRFSSSNQPHERNESATDAGTPNPSANTYNSSYAGGYGASNLHTGQTGANTSEYGASRIGGKATDSNLRDSRNYNTRGESNFNNSHGQQGFGGNAAAGGSSFNTQEPAKRRSSGPHSSNLLNKLDPRVKSSSYEGRTASGQQRG